MKYLICYAMLAVLAGCAGIDQPVVAYEPANHPFSDTAVFYPAAPGAALAQFLKVNGKEMSCIQTGCPRWVRVLPGDNTFTIRYTEHDAFGSAAGVTEVVVRDMKPRHVYRAYFDRAGKSFSMRVVDLGENAHFGPPKPDGTRYKPSFD